jgi:methyl-accepting chemotaxis protein-1 (serine sensor receptor)
MTQDAYQGTRTPRMTLTIKARLGLAMGFVAILMTVIGALGLIGMRSSNEANRQTYAVQLPGAIAVGNMEIFVARERMALDRAALAPEDPKTAATLERAHGFRVESDGAWNKYMTLPRDAVEDRLAQETGTKREDMERAIDDYIAAIAHGNHQGIIDAANAMTPVYVVMTASDNALKKYQGELGERGYERAQQRYATLQIACIVMVVLGVVTAGLSWLSLRRAIGGPIADALQHFERIAHGDLREAVHVRSHDEMGLLLAGLSRMRASLIDTVTTVRGGVESIGTATREIASGNADLSGRTESQAASLQQTAASMEQLTGTVRQNADNARQASGLAANAAEIANRGNDVVGRVSGTMSDINSSSNEIADIIGIIESIAFQTNILALNAAVEAARAGEQGRGFAVVASEVRNLAQRSSSAAKEIRGLILKSVERVKSGTSLAQEAGQTMSDIITAVKRVTDIMGEITAASEEQSAGIEQVARAVTQMDGVTQQNAALVEQAAAAAAALESQAQTLRQAVAIFRFEPVALAA